MAIDLRIFDRNYQGGNPYTPGTNAYNAQNAFAAMTAAAEKNVIRDPQTKGVLGYTEAAGVTPLPGQTISIYNPAGTEVIRTQTGQPLQQPGNLFPQFDMSSMLSGFNDLMQSTARRQEELFNSMARYNVPAPPTQTASVQTAAPQSRRMGSIGSSFGRSGGLRIKSVNI